MLDAEVVDNFILGFDEGSLGDTRTYVGTIGHTWTLSPTLVLDGNFGINRMEQTVTGPDYGDNFGTDRYGIPGTNGDNIRASGLPVLRHHRPQRPHPGERLRLRHDAELDAAVPHRAELHVQLGAHQGDAPSTSCASASTWSSTSSTTSRPSSAAIGGVRGRFSFANDLTGTPGYVSPGWNSFGGFLLGLQSIQAKDVQEIEMSGREWQMAAYIRDRWQVGRAS